MVVGDTAESFAQGLSRILELLAQQNQQIVADGVRKTIWERVAADTLVSLLESIQ